MSLVDEYTEHVRFALSGQTHRVDSKISLTKKYDNMESQ